LGILTGNAGEINFGVLAALWPLSGVLLILGGLLFGIATFRAGILSRWAAGLLAVAAVLTPAGALLPHEHKALVAVPVGLALAWLGYALWSERREQAAEPVPGSGSPQLRQTAAE
jgi:membrane protein implicated in regulation of membrane protease activity